MLSIGPTYVTGGQVEGISLAPDYRVSGAIQRIAVDPANADRVWVGTVNGGVWGTTNATALDGAHWVPLTNQLPVRIKLPLSHN